MNGYFKPKFKNEKKELHTLELDDCDFASDDDDASSELKIIRLKKPCPRCGHSTLGSIKAPYCLGCNWDALLDPSFEYDKCAA